MEKKVVISEMQSIEEPLVIGDVREYLFSKLLVGTRAAHSIIGTEEDVLSYTEKQVQNITKRLLRTKDMLIGIVTTMDVNPLLAVLEKNLGGLTESAHPNKWGNRFKKAPESLLIESDAVGTSKVFVGWPTRGFSDPKTHLMCRLLEVIVGLDEASLLYKALRYTRGLVYGIDIGASNFDNYGMFLIMADVAPGKENRVLNAIVAAVDKVKTKGISNNDLRHAKNQVRMKWLSHLCDPLSCAEIVAQLSIRGWPSFISDGFKFIDEITMNELIAFSKDLFDPVKEVSIVIMPGDGTENEGDEIELTLEK